jgi:hypothetical protein
MFGRNLQGRMAACESASRYSFVGQHKAGGLHMGV